MAGLITRAQMAKIYALSKELGLDIDLIHELVSAETGRNSLKDLTVLEGILIIDRLQGHGTPKGMATSRQKRFIGGLLRSKFRVDSYQWLTVRKAREVIKALKNMKVRIKAPG